MHTCSRCNQTKDDADFGKNKSKKSGLNSYCKPCMASYYAENRERIDVLKKVYNAKNADKLSAKKREWKASNAEFVKSYSQAYYVANKGAARTQAANWKKANPDKVKAGNHKRYLRVKAKQHAHVALYRARKLKATPVWSDKNYVDGMYSICGIMNAVRGASTYSVDHIVPLNSKFVCGLHAHTNLTIMRTSDNKSKNNRYWPDMP